MDLDDRSIKIIFLSFLHKNIILWVLMRSVSEKGLTPKGKLFSVKTATSIGRNMVLISKAPALKLGALFR